MSPGRIEKIAKKYLPESMRLPVRFYRLRLALGFRSLRDLRQRRHWGKSPIPPALLRHRVMGMVSEIQPFMVIGLNSAQNVRSALGRVGRSLDQFQRVLDFGCGCGRTIRWFGNNGSSAGRFVGTDIDATAMAWCRRHLNWAEFQVNDPLPPLSYPDRAFDLVLCLSVINHMDRSYQKQWLAELKRVLKPGGLALISFSGRRTWQFLTQEEKARVEQNGFLFKTDITGRFKQDGLPDYFQQAFQTREQVESLCTPAFHLLDYVEGGLCNYEDLVVLEKPSG